MENLNNKPNYKFRFNNDFYFKPLELENFTVYQIGEIFCESKTIIEEHHQPMMFEFSFITSGTGKMSTNNITAMVKRGDLYVSVLNDKHTIISSFGDSLRFSYVAFNIKENSPLYEMANYILSCFRQPFNRILNDANLFQHMTNILFEINSEDLFSNVLIECHIKELIINVYRLLINATNNQELYQIKVKNSLVYTIIQYLDENYLQITNLKEVSKLFSYDYTYISKKFKKTMGKSMLEYLTNKRFSHAIQLLADEKKSITEVAFILNYASIHNFSRAFKKAFNMSPKDYIKKYHSTLSTQSLQAPPPRQTLNNCLIFAS